MENNNRYENRPWGYYVVLSDDKYAKTKRICVYPNAKLSYQMHHRRSEVWTVVEGGGYVIIDDVSQRVGRGSIVHIPAGRKHRIANDGEVPLQFIEVQYGEYFGEDDIVRFADDYGR